MNDLVSDWRGRLGIHRLYDQVIPALTHGHPYPTRQVTYAELQAVVLDAGLTTQDAKELWGLNLCREGCTWSKL